MIHVIAKAQTDQGEYITELIVYRYLRQARTYINRLTKRYPMIHCYAKDDRKKNAVVYER